MKSTPRVVVPENGTKTETRLPWEKGKTSGKHEEPTKKAKSRYTSWPPERKKKHREYQVAYRAMKAREAKGMKLPYPFKFCPDCAHAMPTVEHRGNVFLRPCHFCPDCGYEIPLLHRGSGKQEGKKQ